MRLIDTDALIEALDSFILDETTDIHGDTVREILERLTTIEERKKGKWIPFDYPWYRCSECGAVRENKSFLENYCPNCGARMER